MPDDESKQPYNTTNDTIFSPAKVDFKKVVYGTVYTSDQLHYLRARNSKFKFGIDARLNDAFRNGFIIKKDGEGKVSDVKKEIVLENTPMVRKVAKWSVEFGWSITIHVFDGEDDVNELAETISEPDAESKVLLGWHPFTNELGGIQQIAWDLKTGLPKYFYIKIPKITDTFKISADRCEIYTWGDYSNLFYGLSDMSAGFDPTVGLMKWEGKAIERQGDYSTIRYVVPLPANAFDPATGLPLAAVQTTADKVFKDVPYMLVPTGSGTIQTVGGPVDPAEEKIIVESCKESFVSAIAVAQSDVLGSSSGQKLSDDKNDKKYSMTSKDIQMALVRFIKATFKRLGAEIEGFKTAAELTGMQKLEGLKMYTEILNQTQIPEIRTAIGKLMEAYFEGEFGMEVSFPNMEAPIDTEEQNEETGEKVNNDSGDTSSNKKTTKKKWFQRGKKNGE